MNLQDIENAKKEIEQLQKELNEKSRKILEESLTNFLKEVPEIYMISWCQYIPGFNDGDACSFTLTEISFFTDIDKNNYKDEDSYDGQNPFSKPGSYVYKNRFEDTYYNDKIQEYDGLVEKYGEERVVEIEERIVAISTLINFIPNDTLENMYGVDVKVKITKEKTTIDEWSCGY
jgi:hypothetical protein